MKNKMNAIDNISLIYYYYPLIRRHLAFLTPICGGIVEIFGELFLFIRRYLISL